MNSSQFPQKPADLRALFNARGLSANKRYGQHFVVDPKILDVIIRLAELDERDVVLEVGTGAGTLTRRIAEWARFVVTVEIDAGIHSLARDLLGNQTNVRLIHGDIMATKSLLNSEVCEKLDVALVDPGAEKLKVVSNLPYNVSTPFLSALITKYGPPDLSVLMVQKELADNLVATPGQKSYSPLSIVMQLLCDIRTERTVGREVFWPRPRVESAIVLARAREVNALPIVRAFPLIRCLFKERRKTIQSVLRRLPPTMGGPVDEATCAKILEAAELGGGERAESLPPERFLVLDRAVSEFSRGE